MTYWKLVLLGLVIILTACAEDNKGTKISRDKAKKELAVETKQTISSDEQYPAPIESIIDQGVEIIDTFEAPNGMIGYAGMMRGQPLAIYLTQDKKHAIVGSFLDADGNNLTVAVMDKLVEGPKNKRAWAELENSAWIADGNDDAPVIIYTFTDTNCPYCHKFREAAEPWIKAGKVQLRHILVAVLRKSSMDEAATILGSDDPEAMLQKHHDQFNQGGVKVDEEAIEKAKVRIQLNTNMMQRLGYGGTPTSLYKDSDGNIKAIQGMPRGETLEQMMGSPKPE